jgi:hypothetical protein
MTTAKKPRSQKSGGKQAPTTKKSRAVEPVATKSRTLKDRSSSKSIEMSLQDLLDRLPCGLTISMDVQDEWSAYYFYAIAAKQVTETFTNFDLSYLNLESRINVAKMEDTAGWEPYFDVEVDGGNKERFFVYGKGLVDKWNEIVTTDWSFT